jgi:hypothetical protein
MLDAEANEKQHAALQAARAAAAAERAAGQAGGAAGGSAADPLFTCFVDTPAGGTVIDGAPGDFRCTVRRPLALPHGCGVTRGLTRARVFVFGCSARA